MDIGGGIVQDMDYNKLGPTSLYYTCTFKGGMAYAWTVNPISTELTTIKARKANKYLSITYALQVLTIVPLTRSQKLTTLNRPVPNIPYLPQVKLFPLTAKCTS